MLLHVCHEFQSDCGNLVPCSTALLTLLVEPRVQKSRHSCFSLALTDVAVYGPEFFPAREIFISKCSFLDAFEGPSGIRSKQKLCFSAGVLSHGMAEGVCWVIFHVDVARGCR